MIWALVVVSLLVAWGIFRLNVREDDTDEDFFEDHPE